MLVRGNAQAKADAELGGAVAASIPNDGDEQAARGHTDASKYEKSPQPLVV